MDIEKKYLFLIKLISFGLYILLCITMFEDIKICIIEKLQISNLNGILLTGIGIGVSLIIFLVRLVKEKDKLSFFGIYRGCIFFFIFIVINLMNAHIISKLFYFLIRMTIGYIYKYLHYSIYVWTASVLLKIGLGIFIFITLALIYFVIMYYVLTPNSPIILFLGMVMEFIGEMMEDGDSGKNRNKKVRQTNSNNGVGIGEIIEAYAEDQKRADIKRTADELEKIRYEISKK